MWRKVNACTLSGNAGIGLTLMEHALQKVPKTVKDRSITDPARTLLLGTQSKENKNRI